MPPSYAVMSILDLSMCMPRCFCFTPPRWRRGRRTTVAAGSAALMVTPYMSTNGSTGAGDAVVERGEEHTLEAESEVAAVDTEVGLGTSERMDEQLDERPRLGEGEGARCGCDCRTTGRGGAGRMLDFGVR